MITLVCGLLTALCCVRVALAFLTGTNPNLILLRQVGLLFPEMADVISFFNWMIFALPLSTLFVVRVLLVPNARTKAARLSLSCARWAGVGWCGPDSSLSLFRVSVLPAAGSSPLHQGGHSAAQGGLPPHGPHELPTEGHPDRLRRPRPPVVRARSAPRATVTRHTCAVADRRYKRL
jgi:hypothetical protein